MLGDTERTASSMGGFLPSSEIAASGVDISGHAAPAAHACVFARAL
jgi:hypothetical protein